MDPQRRIIHHGTVAIQKDRILDIGLSDEIKEKYEARRVIDASNKVVMPGLIDTHGHPYGLIKGIGEYLDTGEWVNLRTYAEFKGHTEESFEIEGKLSALERLKYGTTFASIFVNRTDDIIYATKNAEAIESIGVKGMIAIGPIVYDWTNNLSGASEFQNKISDVDQSIDVCEEFINNWPKKDRNVFGWLSTSNLNTTRSGVSDQRLEYIHMKILEIAKENNVGLSTHASRGDVSKAHKKYDIFGPKTMIVHATGLMNEEIKILAETKTKVSHCPTVLGFMASSSEENLYPPIVELLEAGVNVGLGTDGPAGRITTFDMFREIKMGMILQRLRLKNRHVMPPGKVLEMATIDAAKVLNMEEEIGSLEKNKKADIILIDMFKPHLVPIYMIPYRLAYEAQGQDVDTVIVNGKVVMENRCVKNVNEKDILDDAQSEAEKIISKCNLHPFMKIHENFWKNNKY